MKALSLIALKFNSKTAVFFHKNPVEIR